MECEPGGADRAWLAGQQAGEPAGYRCCSMLQPGAFAVRMPAAVPSRRQPAASHRISTHLGVDWVDGLPAEQPEAHIVGLETPHETQGRASGACAVGAAVGAPARHDGPVWGTGWGGARGEL